MSHAFRCHTMAILCLLGSLFTGTPAILQAESEQGPHAVLRSKGQFPASIRSNKSSIQRNSERKEWLKTIMTLLKSDAVLELRWQIPT